MRRADRLFVDATAEFRALMSEVGAATDEVAVASRKQDPAAGRQAAAASSSSLFGGSLSFSANLSENTRKIVEESSRNSSTRISVAAPAAVASSSSLLFATRAVIPQRAASASIGASEKRVFVVGSSASSSPVKEDEELRKSSCLSASSSSSSPAARLMLQRPLTAVVPSVSASSSSNSNCSTSITPFPSVARSSRCGDSLPACSPSPAASAGRSVPAYVPSSLLSARSSRGVPGLLGLPISSVANSKLIPSHGTGMQAAATTITLSASSGDNREEEDSVAASSARSTVHRLQQQQEQRVSWVRAHLLAPPASISAASQQHSSNIIIVSSSSSGTEVVRSGSTAVRPSSGSAAVDRLRTMIEAAEADRAARRKSRVRRDIVCAIQQQQQEQEEPPSSEQCRGGAEQQASNNESETSAEESNAGCTDASAVIPAAAEPNENEKVDFVVADHDGDSSDELSQLQNRNWGAERERRRAAQHAEQEASLASFLLERRVMEASSGLVWDERVERAELDSAERVARTALAEILFDSLAVVRAVAAIEVGEREGRAALGAAWREELFVPILAQALRLRERVERHGLLRGLQAWYNRQYSAFELGIVCAEFACTESAARQLVAREWRQALPALLADFSRAALATVAREMWVLEVQEADGRGHVENDALEFFFVATEGQRWSRPLMERRAAATVEATAKWRAHLGQLKADIVDCEAAARMLISRGGMTATLHLLDEEREARAQAVAAQEQRRVAAAIRDAQEYSQRLELERRKKENRDETEGGAGVKMTAKSTALKSGGSSNNNSRVQKMSQPQQRVSSASSSTRPQTANAGRPPISSSLSATSAIARSRTSSAGLRKK